ncbi:13276_t:CDS:2 [Cetraspora pellucida]|uniref:13276_t:CDS:1 n=1 Tax=Cetraspora pellucida TaxID=1433469 RepID=A0A9N8Z559_9GLOM|nr:13276_t:CDS:2 [Cetraspora pellucida]
MIGIQDLAIIEREIHFCARCFSNLSYGHGIRSLVVGFGSFAKCSTVIVANFYLEVIDQRYFTSSTRALNILRLTKRAYHFGSLPTEVEELMQSAGGVFQNYNKEW